MENRSRCLKMITTYNPFHSDLVLAGRSAIVKQKKKKMSTKLHCDIFTDTHFVAVSHSA